MNDCDKTVGSNYSGEDAPIVEYDSQGNSLAISDDVRGFGHPKASPNGGSNSQLVKKNFDGNADSTTLTKSSSGKFSVFRRIEPIDDRDTEVAIVKNVRGYTELNENGNRRISGNGNSKQGGGSRCGKVALWMVVSLLLIISIGGFTYFLIQWFYDRAEIERLNSSKDKLLSVADQCGELQATFDELQMQNKNLTDRLNKTHQELASQTTVCEEERIRLEDFVANLTQKVDDLSEDLDQYEALNAQLASAIEDLDEQNQILNNSNIYHEQLNNQLNESIVELEAQVDYLTQQNEIHAELNERLNVTSQNLSEQVDRLEENVDALEERNENLDLLVTQLSTEVGTLSNLNDNLNNSVSKLETQVDKLTSEIDRLEVLNNNLETIVSFVNETAGNIDESVDAISEFLSEQITAYRSMLLETIQNTYSQRIANWDCAYHDMFRLEDFANDGRLPIGEESYPAVMEYIEERVLSELCLSTTDFEQYLENQYVKQGSLPPISATTNNLVMGLQLYSMYAMNYYFPDENGEGLTKADWAEASYECKNLPDNKRFSMI